MLLFNDPETVQFDQDWIKSDFSAQLSDAREWSATLIVSALPDALQATAEIVRIPVVWYVEDTVLSDATVTFLDWTYEPLRIELP